MAGYWTRHRLFLTLIICAAVAFAGAFLFTYPGVMQKAEYYNSQSMYKNTDIDFIAPEPSFEQVSDLPGTNGINKVFPYYMTKTQVSVNGKSRNTTVLLSDQFENVDFTMYNEARLIEKSSTQYDNPILVDWKFCHDTSAQIGDTVSFTIGGTSREFQIYAIYETNSVYDGGAILAEISEEQKNAIAEQSNNNGYSGMFVSASDYGTCKAYLTTDYRPLGRLKDRDQFTDEDQYQVHYNAIMSSGYANEITDFRVREDSLSKESESGMSIIGGILAAIILIAFNIAMSRRGCEKAYFTKQCIPKGKDVRPYYRTSFFCELILTILLFAVFFVLRLRIADDYIPRTAFGIEIAIVPAGILAAELISMIMNNSMVSVITRKVEQEKKAKEKATREAAGKHK